MRYFASAHFVKNECEIFVTRYARLSLCQLHLWLSIIMIIRLFLSRGVNVPTGNQHLLLNLDFDDWYNQLVTIFENIDIDIDLVILENIDIYIEMDVSENTDMEFLENIDISISIGEFYKILISIK